MLAGPAARRPAIAGGDGSRRATSGAGRSCVEVLPGGELAIERLARHAERASGTGLVVGVRVQHVEDMRSFDGVQSPVRGVAVGVEVGFGNDGIIEHVARQLAEQDAAFDEVLELADNVIFLEAGQANRQESVFDFAITGPDADLPQGTAMIRCRVTGQDPDNELTILNFENQTMYLAARSHSPGDTIRVRIPARDVSLTRRKPEASSILNVFEGTINEIHDDRDGPTVVVLVSCGEQQLLARITRKSLSDLSLNVGQRIYAQVKGVALMVNNDP